MKYISKNESDRFKYDDCYISEVKWEGDSLAFTVDALIVKSNNSQNTNYTDSYADTAQMVFEHAKITRVVLEGFKRYDANDNLIEEVEDKQISVDDVNINDFAGQYLPSVQKVGDGEYCIEIEYADEDPSAVTDVYEVRIAAEEVCVLWDKYLNRVQN